MRHISFARRVPNRVLPVVSRREHKCAIRVALLRSPVTGRCEEWHRTPDPRARVLGWGPEELRITSPPRICHRPCPCILVSFPGIIYQCDQKMTFFWTRNYWTLHDWTRKIGHHTVGPCIIGHYIIGHCIIGHALLDIALLDTHYWTLHYWTPQYWILHYWTPYDFIPYIFKKFVIRCINYPYI